MSGLSQFIEALATNPKLQQDYAAAPEKTMQQFGLQRDEIDAVLSGDKTQVEKLTGKATLPVTLIFPAK